MEKLTSLNFSFDKIIIQVLIPGLISIFPFFLLYLHFHPIAKTYFYQNQSITIIAVTFLSLIAGMILENISGRFEVSFLDRRLKKEITNFDETWISYLQLAYDKEPIEQRYLRNILLRMKFEISAGFSLLPMILGLFVLNCHTPIIENFIWMIILCGLIPLLIALYLLFFEASSSARILAKTREILVERYFSKD